MGPLPEPVVGGGVAAFGDGVAEQVMPATGVVRHEIEQDAHAAVVCCFYETDKRRFAAIARFHFQEVLVVVAVMRRAGVDGAEPEHVAAE